MPSSDPSKSFGGLTATGDVYDNEILCFLTGRLILLSLVLRILSLFCQIHDYLIQIHGVED